MKNTFQPLRAEKQSDPASVKKTNTKRKRSMWKNVDWAIFGPEGQVETVFRGEQVPTANLIMEQIQLMSEVNMLCSLLPQNCDVLCRRIVPR